MRLVSMVKTSTAWWLVFLTFLFGMTEKNFANQHPANFSSHRLIWLDIQSLGTEKSVVQPEWAASEGTIVSSTLLRSENMALLEALGTAGDLWITGKWKDTSGWKPLEQLREKMKASAKEIFLIDISKQLVSGNSSAWARDWSPLIAETLDQKSRVLVDFSYLPERPLDDDSSQALKKSLDATLVEIPAKWEGGNFMINGKRQCVISSKGIGQDLSQLSSDPKQLLRLPLFPALRKYVGCKSVAIVPPMPFENTGHIDMWAKFLNDETIAVNELSEQTIELTPPETKKMADSIRNYLEERAKEFVAAGWKVERIPQPSPIFSYWIDDDSEGDRRTLVIRSYTNSLYLNRSVFIPRYEKLPESYTLARGNIGINTEEFTMYDHPLTREYPDASLHNAYESKVRDVYRKYGFEDIFIISDNLAVLEGSAHCATMQVPIRGTNPKQ